MSQLMQIRQRIKTIETIEKITHAMRLIAMSSHTRLKLRCTPLKDYFQEVKALFDKAHSFARAWDHPCYTSYPHRPELIIIIGSQKGLCGNFNTSIFNACRQLTQSKQGYEFITIGKKAHDYVHSKLDIIPLISFNNFSAQNYLTIAQDITNYIFNLKTSYSKITVIGSAAKSFFSQIPSIYQLFPLKRPTKFLAIEDTKYIWDEPPTKLLDQLLKQYIMAQLSV
ncbi:MAG TPA: FoF1 ATP synthase subunit gamma, partial [Patescibacteria group bacterium]|nr:FoF1 ATP synthase subunit gamma [Patescibacteria group bacterium]